MPRPRRARPNSVVASAVAYTSKRKRLPSYGATARDWQTEAWRLHDVVGELQFATTWKSNAMSRITLRVVQDVYDPETGQTTEQPVTTGPPVEALDSLFYGEAGQSQMLADLTKHLDVPGECVLIGWPPDDRHPTDWWEVLSNTEAREDATGVWLIDRGGEENLPQRIDLDQDEDPPLIMRVWRPHPKRHWEATSPVRAALPIARTIEQLTMRINAEIDSRMAGAGVLIVPTEATFVPPPMPPNPDGTPADEVDGVRGDPLMEGLVDIAITAIGDRGSAAAVAPGIIRMPGEHIQHVKHITFSTPFDERTRELLDAMIRRLALSLDMPPEVLLGQADSNHWSAWQIDETGLKVHIAPLAELICNALTTRWLWPVLEGRTGDEINDGAMAATQTYRITYDDSDLRMRPDLSPQAALAHERFALDDAGYRDIVGLEDYNAPENTEILRRLLLAVAQSGDPALAVQALAYFGGTLEPPATPAPAQSGGPAQLPQGETPPQPRALPTGPATTADRNPGEQAAALLMSSELLVLRATERARNRVAHRGKTPRPIPGDKLDAALAGAWDHAERVACMSGVDPASLTTALDGFTRRLLASGRGYDSTELMRALTGVKRRALRSR